MVQEITGVSEVVEQDSIMYDTVIRKIKPDYVIHGDNWCKGPMKAIRENAKKQWKLTVVRSLIFHIHMIHRLKNSVGK